jgi:bacterioferritin-associated ferredoxin
MYVCVCRAVRDRDLRQAALETGSFEQAQARTGVSTCCRTCEPMARELVQRTLEARADCGQPA